MVKNHVKKFKKYSIGILINTKPNAPLSHSIHLQLTRNAHVL